MKIQSNVFVQRFSINEEEKKIIFNAFVKIVLTIFKNIIHISLRSETKVKKKITQH